MGHMVDVAQKKERRSTHTSRGGMDGGYLEKNAYSSENHVCVMKP